MRLEAGASGEIELLNRIQAKPAKKGKTTVG